MDTVTEAAAIGPAESIADHYCPSLQAPPAGVEISSSAAGNPANLSDALQPDDERYPLAILSSLFNCLPSLRTADRRAILALVKGAMKRPAKRVRH